MKRPGATAGGVVAVLVSLAIVVLASRGDPGDRTAAAFETAAVGRTLFLSVLGVAFAISAVLAVWALWPDGSGSPRPTPKSRWLPYLVIAALILVLAVFAPERPSGRGTDGDDAAAAAPATSEEEAGDRTALRGRASPTASLALTAVAVAALVAFTVALRRRPDEDGAAEVAAGDGGGGADRPAAFDDAAVAAIGDGDLDAAIAAVAEETDARRAVLLAYAVLDARLAGTPASRIPTSTPQEWLRRIRHVHGASTPGVADGARRLTNLYERARFGIADLSPAHRDEAVSALRTLHELGASDGVRLP